MMVMLLFDGVDQVTAFSAIAASLNNLGPGLGDVASGFGSLSDLSKWVCVVAMLLGRLEIFTVLVLYRAPSGSSSTSAAATVCKNSPHASRALIVPSGWV